MNNGDHDEPIQLPAPTTGFGLDDLFYTLFRHKFIILGAVGLGLIGAVVVRLMRQPVYESRAEISVPYISESTGLSSAGPTDQIKATDPTGLNILSLEVRILNSLDLFTNVAQKVGPNRILAAFGGGDDLMAAAWQIQNGLTVATPRPTLTVSFKHPDPTVVQPVLAALIDAYRIKSAEIHQGASAQVGNLLIERSNALVRLDTTEVAIKQLKTTNNVLFPEETKEAYKKQIAKVQNELFLARDELASRRLELKALTAVSTNSSETVVEPGQVEAYSELALRLDELKKHQRKLLGELEYTDSHPQVVRTKERIAELIQQKSDLERQFPELARFGKTILRPGTNAPPIDPTEEAETTQKLASRVEQLQLALTNLQTEASVVMELEPTIAALQRRYDDQLKDYQVISKKLEKAQDTTAGGNMADVRVVLSPTPPALDYKKLIKMVGAVFAGFVALGLGIAFLIDLVFDRTIKRSTDVKRQLHLPVILTIPHTHWSGRWLPPWLARRQIGPLMHFDPKANRDVLPGEMGITPWNPVHHLRRYTDGLRERLLTYFEVNRLNHQPKLVALTSCGAGVGVTSLASGLAASLSMTGNGNVLLVDLNVDGGSSHSFHKGKPGCDLSNTPGMEEDSESANHFLATLSATPGDLSKTLPSVFSDVLPDLKVRGYDYIVFDMPPVSQTSLTPRLASHMDLTLFVIESEQTNKQVAAESSALMRDAQANVTTILNKCKAHVPAAISTGF